MTIKYLKQLKERKQDEFSIQNQKFIFNKSNGLMERQKKYQEKIWDRVLKTQNQIDQGRLPKNSTEDDLTNYFNTGNHSIIGGFYLILGFLLYVPITITWLIGEILRFVFSVTSFYEYTIFINANIYNFLLLKQAYIYIYVLEFDGMTKEDVIDFRLKSGEFANYSVWELFYKK